MTPDSSPVVLALGFDLFFRPKLVAAGRAVGLEVRAVGSPDALAALDGAVRVVADVSAAGVEETLRAVRAARPDVPIVACYPHVEEHRAAAVRALGGVAIPRGAFIARLEDAIAGRLRG